MKSGGSAGMLIYCRILSTDIILFSKVHKPQTTKACSMFRLSPYVIARPAIPESWALREDFELIYYHPFSRTIHLFIIDMIPGSMRPVGRLIKNIKEKANIRDDNTSNRKQSHSLAPLL
jgi:hypothetical protein